MFKSRVPVILQAERAECGVASLAMVAAYFGRSLRLTELRSQFARLSSGPTLRAVLSMADRVGLVGRPVRVNLSELRGLVLPAILHWEFDHFVVLTRVRRRGVVVHDPAAGRRFVSRRALDEAFTGVAVEFTTAANFTADIATPASFVVQLLRSFQGLNRYLVLMLFLLFVSQVLALAPPVATQLLIDEVVLGQDTRWLHRVLAGIGLILMTMYLLDALRRWIALYAGTRLATDSTSSVVQHLLSLPALTIESRAIGDMLSRIDSLRPIRAALTDTVLTGAVQLIVIATTLTVMFWYSPTLALVSCAALVLTGSLHASLLPATRSLQMEALVSQARSSASLIESLRSYRGVHALGLSMQRLAHWQRYFVDATNAEARQGKLTIAATFGQGVIAGVEHLAFLSIGIAGIIDKRLTLGVLFAFLSLRGRLTTAAVQLITATRDLYLLRSHVERVGDIVAETPEPPAPRCAMRRPINGAIECRGLTFAYPGDPNILEGFDCRIQAGESVLIRGPSGVGKSTLLFLMSAGCAADAGTVLYDGVEFELWDLRVLRSHFGVVLQQDRLFHGSIADNISCFDAAPDIGRVREAACRACIWEETQALPMTIHTLVGDGGAGLSGGQAQRVLLARALYRQPRILFLDEATSHLDGDTETRVLENLAALGITIVSVTHHDSVLHRGGRVIRLDTPHNPGDESAADYQCAPHQRG